MFKEVLQSMDIAWMSNIGLVLFFITFIAICGWTLTRKRSDVERWNNLPLEEGDAVNFKPIPMNKSRKEQSSHG